jgi:hypothetical protein
LPPHLVPLFIVGIWVVVTTSLGFASGHVTLLKRYPPREEPEDKVFFSVSGDMRGVPSRQALYVGIGRTGLHLGPNWFFRPIFFRGMPCVPWSDIRCVRRQTSSWFNSSKFEISSISIDFTIAGAAGRAIEQRLDSLAAPGAATS